MNEHNHHKIIEEFTKDKSIPGIDITHILEEASDFSDDFRGVLRTKIAEKPKSVLKDIVVDAVNNPYEVVINPGYSLANSIVNNESIKEFCVEVTDESQYYYYHFFYNIEVDKNTLGNGKITLKRYKKDSPKEPKPESFLKEDDLGKNTEKYMDNPKLFFTAVNDREKYFLSGIIKSKTEGSNQSNCVAFLHAMGAKTIHEKFNENNPRRTFEEHLKKCFAEYLYLKDETEALFMLGIALHGIMDSFTPSHTGFQVYEDQNMALHAQGDVLPIKDKDDCEPCLSFIPGQYNEETKAIMKVLAWIKGYNDNEFLNDREYEMLRCFLIISKVAYKNNNKELDIYEINNLCYLFQICFVPLSKINIVLSEGFTYGKSAFDHSIIALQTLDNVYSILSTKRKKIRDFSSYKAYKAAKSCCQDAVNAWRDGYKKIDTNIIFRSSYLNGFKTTSWIASAASAINTAYQISKDTVVGTGEALGDMAFDAQQKAETAFQIGKDTVVGTGEALGNMAFNAQQKVEAAIQIGKDTVSGAGEALGNMAYDAQCTAVKIAKDILERYDQLDEKNRQINPDFNMFGGPNKA